MTHTARPDTPRVVLFPPFILLGAIVIAVGLDYLVPLAWFPAPSVGSWLSWVGVLVFLAGLGIAVSGSREFQKQATNIDPRKPALKLVTSGPYRFTRNPMYLGMSIMLAGLVIGLSLEWGALAWIGFVLTMHFGVVLREEAYLTRVFGAPYSDFVAHTRRWL